MMAVTILVLSALLLTPALARAETATVNVVHVHPTNGSSYYAYSACLDSGPCVPVEARATPNASFEHGDRVQATQVAGARGVAAGPWTLAPLMARRAGPQVAAAVSGIQPAVILMVNFTNDPSKPETLATIQSWAPSFSKFYSDNSYGAVSMPIDVFGWLTLPMANTGCDYWDIQNAAYQAATAAGIDMAKYTRRVYLFPRTPACPWAGLGTVGGNPSSAWINGPVNMWSFTHELGHNYGLYHSHAMLCGTGADGALKPPCTVNEYGDQTDAMGYGSSGPFNPYQKERLGWLDASSITTATQSGTYPLAEYRSLSGVRALKIPRGDGGYLWVRVLGPCPGCSAPKPGVYVYLSRGPDQSYHLDMSPETMTFDSRESTGLDVGRTFTDPLSGIGIRTVSAGDTGATIAVTMAGGPVGPSVPTALAGPPKLTWSAGLPATQTGFLVERAPGVSATFAAIATTVAASYADAGGGPGSCYRVRATNAEGVSGPSNVACASATPPPPPPPPPGDPVDPPAVILTITGHSAPGREMTFKGTVSVATAALTATVDGRAILAKYITIDKRRLTWSVKVAGLLKGPHTFIVASSAVTATRVVELLK